MSRKTRRRILFGLGGFVLLVALVIGGTYVYVNIITGDAPDPLALDDTAPDGAASGAELDGTWTVAEGSEAGYRVDEVLNGQDNTVVGRTQDVTGEFTVTDGSLESGRVEVDMTTVTTDSDARDSQFRGPIMMTDEFPTSTFELTEPVPLDEVDGSGRVSLTATGDLTLRDTTRPVEVSVDLQVSDDTVQVAGSAPITFTDFGIEPPDLGFVRVEDSGVVEFLLTLDPTSAE
ncbi:polyisoprenoid-binding protein YceI [Haloactinopolyspora alba]|uniref:Polyisoprenoid-binding protein YceI n=1 Tax=Haloactinopolyspora alba TaxID=648780 RepID=A0A2P8EGG1_9ACTN|nr:YceI family protein [Haloactinopolyspora alba]PSL08547.1 polyisoprenoid-binding protein YceI [Haloactinopolyspora alba]